MTFKTDLAACAPTATAKLALQARGTNITTLMQALQQHASEMQILLKQIIAMHPNDSVLSAAVVAGGSGGSNGPVTITGTTGVGTKFTARGNISSGALTGSLIIVNAGSYTTDPTSLSSEPVTGGGLSGATVSLVMSGDNAVLASLNSVLAELT
jgi:CO dehydrogenase/acetyl-CoA synthase gamma subunit (corrinoid Fe-S protein)